MIAVVAGAVEGLRLRAECVEWFIADYRAGRGRPALSAAAWHAAGLRERAERARAELAALVDADTEAKARHIFRTLRGDS